MKYLFLSCWVNGSFEPDFTFEKTIHSRKELIEIIKTWSPAGIRRVR
jgi:hypothetical protein